MARAVSTNYPIKIGILKSYIHYLKDTLEHGIDEDSKNHWIRKCSSELYDIAKAERLLRIKEKFGIRIGETQLNVLRSLVEHKKWCRMSGWVWTTTRATERILKSLAKLELAVIDESGEYRPTELAKLVIEDLKNERS